MRHKISILLVLFTFIVSAYAFASSEIETSRAELGNALNGTVKDLKQIYSDTETKLTTTKTDAESLKVIADTLAKRSENAEVNPSILEHGNSTLPSCTYATQNLRWDGNAWECKNIEIDSECQSAAPDEYRYKDSDGNYVCSKSPEGESLSYYWIFRGYSATCTDPSIGYNKLYDCNYKNKNSQVVQVSDSNCKSSKPSVSKKTCTTSWIVAGWGSCNKSCGGGTQYRSVTCKSGYSCTGAKPATSQSCNTQMCTTSWRTGSWGSCSKSCGGGTKSRSVYCPSGYSCPGAKPATTTSCNTAACSKPAGCSHLSCNGYNIVSCQKGTSDRCTYVSGANGCVCTYKSSKACYYDPIQRKTVCP